MANEDVVDLVITTVRSMIEYTLPIIGVLAGVTFVLSWLMYILFGLGRRIFRD